MQVCFLSFWSKDHFRVCNDDLKHAYDVFCVFQLRLFHINDFKSVFLLEVEHVHLQYCAKMFLRG